MGNYLVPDSDAPEDEPIALVKIYEGDGLGYSRASGPGYRISTEVVGDQSAANLEKIQLVARAAELGLGGYVRDGIGDALQEIREALGPAPGAQTTSVRDYLFAIGTNLSEARKRLEELAAKRVQRAEARDKAKK